MLTDLGSIEKVRGALEKLRDAEEKICSAMIDAATTVEDKGILQEAVDLEASASMAASKVLPPE